MNTESSIFGSGDPPPKRLYPFGQQAPFVLVSDHAGRAVPESLGDLGVSAADWDRHIAYDIGIHSVGVELAKRLKVPLLEQPYSRLVIDCNRAPGHPTSIPESSDGTAIPANRNLSTSAFGSLRIIPRGGSDVWQTDGELRDRDRHEFY